MKKGVMLVDKSARAFRKNFGLFVIVSLFILLISIVMVFGGVWEEIVIGDEGVVDESIESLIEGIDRSLVEGEIGEGYGGLIDGLFEETGNVVFEEQAEKNPGGSSNLDLVSRKEYSNTYFVSDNNYVTELHTLPINMKDINGEYKPYEEVTSFSFDGNSLILEWNSKSVKLNLYTKDNQKKKERFKDKSNEEKQKLDFKTKIEKGKGNYYFDHTLNKAKQPKKIGYDIETSGVSCYGEGYSLICDEQKINFRDAVVKQGLNVDIDDDGRYLEISGDDLSYIDPTITSIGANISDGGHTDAYCYEYNFNYSFDSDFLNDIGSIGTVNSFLKCNGLLQFDVTGLPSGLVSTSQINSVYLYVKYENGVSEEGNGALTNFCVVDDLEDYNWEPDYSEVGELRATYKRLDDCDIIDTLFTYSFPASTDAWYSKRIDNLDSDVAQEIIYNRDGSPDNVLAIGIKGESDFDTDESIDFYDEADGVNAPYVVINYTLPGIAISISSIGRVFTSPYFTSDDTPLANITTDKNGDCRASFDGDENYSEMSDDIDCSGDGGTAHSCQFGSLSDGVTTLYFACNSTNGDESTSLTNTETNVTIYSSPPPSPLSWPVCNPADPCCDQNGNLMANGYVCKSAHNAVCNNSAGCGGYAYEDRCDGSNSWCPDSNDFIDYGKACDDVVCSSNSCSDYTFQPERSCLSGTCQTNDAYACPNNLNCMDASSCKSEAGSVSDCRTGFLFNNDYTVCWLNEANKSAYGMRYDDNGNLISGFGLNYSYNGFNWLVNVTSSSGELVAEYWYDDNGIRVKSIVYSGGENTTTYYFDNFVQIVNSSGVFNETYYYFYDKLVGMKSSSGEILFYHPDHLGSSTLITNSSGDIVEELEYEPFGALVNNSNERFTYTGQEQDVESGLMYYGARYYDPDIAKFVQADTVTADIYDPQNLNRYSYAKNSPYVYIDEKGEWAVRFDMGYSLVAYNIILGKSGGFVLVYDPKTGKAQFAGVSSRKMGLGVGLGVSAGPIISFYESAVTVPEIEGITESFGGTVTYGDIGGTVDVSKGSISVGYSPGLEAEVHRENTFTQATKYAEFSPKTAFNKATTTIKNVAVETGTKVVETGTKIVKTGTNIVKSGAKAVTKTAKKVYKKVKFW